jgi:hypothetical protein
MAGGEGIYTYTTNTYGHYHKEVGIYTYFLNMATNRQWRRYIANSTLGDSHCSGVYVAGSRNQNQQNVDAFILRFHLRG